VSCGIVFLFAQVVFAQQTPPPQVPSRPIYTAVRSDVSPQVRAGRTFVPVRVITEQFGAKVLWQPNTQSVLIQQTGQREIRLVVNSRTATIGGTTVTLDAAPFIFQGRTLVPLRFIAESYGTPIAYDAATASVNFTRDNRFYVLPLESTKSGVVIADPKIGELVRNPIRVQGQANVFEGALIIEVQDTRGTVIARTFATAGMGGFYPFSTLVYYNMPTEEAVSGRIVVYSEDGRGDGHVLARDSVNVLLASTQ
jgi:hypothetical protein